MAGGAFTFAEILRDEYVYLHGNEPPLRADVKEKHLRELSSLIQRVKAAPKEGTGRHSLLKAYCDFTDADNGHAVVTEAFRRLMRTEIVAKDDKGNGLTLFEALLRDDEVAEQLRAPELLRKLAGVRGARRIVFEDEESALLVGDMNDLCDLFCGVSAAVRLLIADDRDLFRRFPALLGTIADDKELDARLSDPKKGAQERSRLRKAFDEKEHFLARWWPFGDTPPSRATEWELSKNAMAVQGILDGEKHPQPGPQQPLDVDALAVFNSFLLETAFIECFTDSYDVRSMNMAFHEQDMAALCLSGGGIRSATFNLGILQGLADHGLLPRFHYLSSVSGGGYIASWLSSWIRRHNEGVQGVATDLSAPPADPEEPEVRPIRHLREYSSYLAPRSSLLSADTWTIATIYIRNLLLNWTILIPVIALVLILPRLMERATFIAWNSGAVAVKTGYAALMLSALAVVLVAMVRPRTEKRSGNEQSASALRLEWIGSAVWLLPLASAAVTFCIFWASLHALPDDDLLRDWTIRGWMLPAMLAAGSAIAGAIYAGRRIGAFVPGGNALQRIAAYAKLLVRWEHLPRAIGEIAAAAIAGLFSGWLLRALFANLFPPDLLGVRGPTLFFEQYVCLGIPLFLFVFFIEATLLVGFTTISSSDHDREWWARSAALMFIAAFFYLAGSAIVIFLAILMAQLPEIVASIGGVSAVASWVLAKKEKLKAETHAEKTKSKLLTIALKIAATITVALLLALIVLATTQVLALMQTIRPVDLPRVFRWKATALAKMHVGALQQTSFRLIGMFFVAAGGVAFAMSRLLNANIYSMHGMYRNRLIRAYLGASRWFRRPDAFTGFDAQDNIDMFELRAEALWTSSFIDFDLFAATLAKHKLRELLPATVQDRLDAFVNGPKRPPRAEIRSEVTRALNELMVTHDLEHGVAAPRSVRIFIANRKYLDQVFAGMIVPVPHDEPVAPAPAPAESTALVNTPEPIEHRPSRALLTPEEERVYSELRTRQAKEMPKRERPPLHIVNAALNLVGGENLAWQERKADSFTISPLHSGNRRLGYRDSFDYGEHVSLGTALAISGAAVSPNMGYHSSPAVTFLMTLFNARLGWWLGNPSQSTYDEPGPTMTMDSLVAEASGTTNDTSDWVFLSDGGHFDNLGVYEMVRRRCHYIVVCDATADGKYAFSDLGNAVRKVRVDMGIPITLRTAYLAPEQGQKDGRYCALGLIHYGDVDDVPHEQRFGYLLYIKPAVYSECPADVRNYKNDNESFPHESTVDQFFGESQFESYRALGRHIIGQICDDRLDVKPRQVSSVGDLMTLANDYVDKHAAPTGDANVHSIADLVKWMQRSLA